MKPGSNPDAKQTLKQVIIKRDKSSRGHSICFVSGLVHVDMNTDEWQQMNSPEEIIVTIQPWPVPTETTA